MTNCEDCSRFPPTVDDSFALTDATVLLRRVERCELVISRCTYVQIDDDDNLRTGVCSTEQWGCAFCQWE